MLNHEFIAKGFCHIHANHYLNHENASSLHDLKKMFDLELEDDGYQFRRRSYLKLRWTRKNNAIAVADNQSYFQTPNSNTVDGGKVRKFKVMDKAILDIPLVNNIIQQNLALIDSYREFVNESHLTIGLHFIRYQVQEAEASYSSPAWLHKDDEPLVFIHLINLSKTALGGDNLIADSHSQTIKHVIRLENEIETLVLNRNVYHAVTPLGSRQGVAYRDVILFTVEPDTTQQL